jgi:hypothetical protein
MSKNKVSLLGLHGEKSLRVSPVQMLRVAREAEEKLALEARGVAYEKCQIQQATPRQTINGIPKTKKKKKKVRHGARPYWTPK